jgi:hypothetical protein
MDKLDVRGIQSTHVRFYARLARYVESSEQIAAGESREVTTRINARYVPAPGRVQLRVLFAVATHDCQVTLDVGMTWMTIDTARVHTFPEVQEFLAEYGAPRISAVIGTEFITLLASVGSQPVSYPPELEHEIANTIRDFKAPPNPE